MIKKPIRLTIFLSYSQAIALLKQLTDQIERKTWQDNKHNSHDNRGMA